MNLLRRNKIVNDGSKNDISNKDKSELLKDINNSGFKKKEIYDAIQLVKKYTIAEYQNTRYDDQLKNLPILQNKDFVWYCLTELKCFAFIRFVDDSILFDSKIAREILLYDMHSTNELSLVAKKIYKHFASDRDFVLYCVKERGGENVTILNYASDEILKDKEIICETFGYISVFPINDDIIDKICKNFAGDMSVITTLFSCRGYFAENVEIMKKMFNNKEVAMKLRDISYLKYFDKDIQNDPEVLLNIIKNNPKSIDDIYDHDRYAMRSKNQTYIPQNLYANSEFAEQLVLLKPEIYEVLPISTQEYFNVKKTYILAFDENSFAQLGQDEMDSDYIKYNRYIVTVKFLYELCNKLDDLNTFESIEVKRMLQKYSEHWDYIDTHRVELNLEVYGAVKMLNEYEKTRSILKQNLPQETYQVEKDNTDNNLSEEEIQRKEELKRVIRNKENNKKIQKGVNSRQKDNFDM